MPFFAFGVLVTLFVAPDEQNVRPQKFLMQPVPCRTKTLLQDPSGQAQSGTFLWLATFDLRFPMGMCPIPRSWYSDSLRASRSGDQILGVAFETRTGFVVCRKSGA